jgi:cyclophilin family peptidyl-prolyl cis-trans isomerase
MKRTLFFSSLAAAALLGAGCSSAPAAPTNDAYSSAPAAQAPAPTPEATPAPATTSTDSSATPSSTMSTLAFPGVLPDAEVNKKVLIKTTLGNIEIQIDPKAGPNAASNFVYLVKQHFYDGLIFHRVIPGFMIQGGDPTGTGMGGPGYQFADDKVTGQYNKGIVAMANAGPDTNGSQFFIMVADVPLGPNYSIFGHVIAGQDVADKISMVDRDAHDRPNTEVKMTSVTIE